MQNNHINRRLVFLMPFLLITLLFWSCTDLDETIFSQATPENFYGTEDELIAAVMPVYANLREYTFGDYSQTQEVSSDEIVVPTRGGDWDDGGVWRALQEHTWTKTHGQVNGVWTSAFRGIARANSTLENLGKSTSDSDLIPTFMAEVQFLRAFYYWWLVDLFGGVPIVTAATTDPDNPPSPSTRTQVFDFIVTEINEALPGLEDASTLGAAGYGRVSKGAAHAMLATLYLNAEVYTGTSMWDECVAECNEVINSGTYELIANYPDIFALENEGPGNTENIFVVGHLAQPGVGFERHMATLHYNQIPSNPWNGFAVLAEFYNAFDTDDVRLNKLLVGQQFVLGGPTAGDSALDRQDNPLFFTVEFPLFGAAEGDGVRMLKWPVDPNMSGGDAGDDMPIFRYAHILLAKAEAQLRLGNNTDALDLVNQVRARAFEPDKPLTAITLDDILAERGFELFWENYRRQDQIRHGKYLDKWTLKDANTADTFRRIFPIPQIQMDANPNLVQNPGY